ncbi:MAG: hypothetical protein KGN34_17545 [Sphingomonadales bacterium]|nr:hypothetical protein [Sphingomonadales bacterium]
MSESPLDQRQLDPLAERNRIIRARNKAMGLLLLGVVVLFFAITIVRVRA